MRTVERAHMDARGPATRSRRRTGRGVVGLMTVAVLCAGGAAQAAPPARQASAPATLVTGDGPLTRQYEAPDVLVDQDDPQVMYLSAVGLRTGACDFYVSDDGGEHWTKGPSPQQPPYNNCSLGPQGPQNVRTELTQTPDGTLYYLFHSHDPAAGGARSLLLSRSTDQGRTWDMSEVRKAPAATGQDDIEMNWEGHLAFDPANPDTMYVMWRRSYSDDRPTRPFMAVSEDGGVTFGDAFQMFDKNPGFDGPRPIVVGDRLVAFYRLSPGPDEPDDAPTRLVAGISTDQGKTWEEHEITAQADASEPIPVYDRDSGTFHVVWHDNRNGDLDVFYSRSTDATEWSEPQRLNDDEAENDYGQYYPQIARSPDGTLHVAWYDYRDDPFGPAKPGEAGGALGLGSNLGRFQSVYTTSSSDGGETWAANLRLNDVLISRSVGTWNGQYFIVVPPAIAATDDEVVAAWSDTRQGDDLNGTQDIAVATLAAAEGPGTDTTLMVAVGAAGLVLGLGLATFGTAMVARRRRRRTAT